MDALEFINIIEPEHCRTSCSDKIVKNGFWSRHGMLNENEWHGRCTRCMYLEIISGVHLPEKFDPEECQG